ncbi:uncharacterized protein LOC143244226 isoform X1 [Tachypleus tridentatus]|uniref:uncharacterized protein LOC143244226 isoform X1 n=1 Tax=Tachypleus tridentatus TaxID=6853 RepID=UPI003FCEF6D0
MLFQNRQSSIALFGLHIQAQFDKLGLSLDNIAESTGQLIQPWLSKCDLSLSHLRKVDIPDWKYCLLFAEHLLNHPSIPIYTDGSKFGDCVQNPLYSICLLLNCMPFLLPWITEKVSSTQTALFTQSHLVLYWPWNRFTLVHKLFLPIFKTDWPISLKHLLLFSISGYQATLVFAGTSLLTLQLSICSGTVTVVPVPYMDYGPVFKVRLCASCSQLGVSNMKTNFSK